ncbi:MULTISPECIES: GntR family transcriptional regulator [unclassified Beijerinckia]|uniref:GntR family transcriptional regulator n=1 Tax=unclassified Beijerinckia TaxID=2638183 RepID=UPI000A9D701D|nr:MULTISPECIES: GntR family transcriptional regulator [unclassified Beijerinckia]
MTQLSLDQGDLSLYRQLETIVRGQIIDGELSPGDRLPSEADLSAQYSVSRATVRQALEALEREGLINRHVGRGTFVRALTTQADTTVGRVQHDWREAIALADQAERLTRHAGMPAPPHVANILKVAIDDPVPFFIRMSESEPSWGVRRYLHPRFNSVIAEIAAAKHFLPKLSAVTGTPVTTTKMWAEAILASPRFAMMFKVPTASPMLSIWWIDEADGAAVAVSHMLQPGPLFSLGLNADEFDAE